MDWRIPSGVTRMILLRHGKPSEEMKGRCYGRLDVGLAPEGHAQAERAASLLASADLQGLYSSPRRRALDTAKRVAEGRGLDIRVEEAFREIDFGLFEGLTYEEAERQFPEVYAEWMAHPERVRFPEGETFSEMRERVRAGGRVLRARHVGQCFALVSHGGVNRTLLAESLGMADKHLFRLDQVHAAVNVIDFYGDEPVVKLTNAAP
ncbi:histidine phosphatase family protein [Myxococcus llanfairpwllgwyngyllgogerychwyrndrobwllllantysiliogogogochensis]|uniref:Histidine phosphatase family protein n=1 Tax=Myxococcus llanfairpwllgwyngyllgogerychwyrndrobwllllantysiliogogogochensis TaxID=2590453 RepID=A0A540X0T5_9BACT|nr:histidine phosphatase family protein [Myxococcus llanfairpwllgwyngyllgogerychwyrndrobwllllantysiliogogogochensis]TQF14842.1 histidine phosphatase family protein [Myxococcus llanfairpwllgwyngyllgogerychwyrndrobwllllantysiliogogogochensis]